MSALPTTGRVVLVQYDGAGSLMPAIVLRVTAGGCLDVVAFNDLWPLAPARIMRNLAHVDTLRLDGAPPVWLWPPRAAGAGDTFTKAGNAAAALAAELELEQRAFATSLARFAERLTKLEADSHPPARNMADAGDVETLFRHLERRVEAAEQRIAELELELGRESSNPPPSPV